MKTTNISIASVDVIAGLTPNNVLVQLLNILQQMLGGNTNKFWCAYNLNCVKKHYEVEILLGSLVCDCWRGFGKIWKNNQNAWSNASTTFSVVMIYNLEKYTEGLRYTDHP